MINFIKIIPEFIESIYARYRYYLRINRINESKLKIEALIIYKTFSSLIKLFILTYLLKNYKNKFKKTNFKNVILIIDRKVPVKNISLAMKGKCKFKNINIITKSKILDIKNKDGKSPLRFLLPEIYLYSIIEAIKNNYKVFVLEGDSPEHILVNYIIYIILNTRIGLIQWGSYIYTKLTSAQSYLPYDTFIVKSLNYKSIINRAKTYSKIKKFFICDYQNIKFSKDGVKYIFIVGQPLKKDEFLPKNFVKGDSNVTYMNALKKVFKSIKNNYPEEEVIYIKHPKEDEFISDEIIFHKQSYFNQLNNELNKNSIFYGFFSSLLLDLYEVNANIILCCDNYKGTVFDMIRQKGNIKHLPMNDKSFNVKNKK